MIKLTLGKIFEYEEKLLLIDSQYSVEEENISFGDYITLQQNLDEIGKITNYFFIIIEKYNKENKDEFINNLSMSEINFNEEKLKEIKYLIENYSIHI